MAGGNQHSLALRSDGLVFACGRNDFGQLGDNTTVNKSTYVQALLISNVVALAAGILHSLALRSDGLIFGCGDNSGPGQLGDNTSTKRSTFVQAVGISNIVVLAAGSGFLHSLALRSDGLVFSSGDNGYGQLGVNSVIDKLTFVQALAP
jgi:alpha-tubulin suppressor-like RCC1 family protein